MTRRFSNHESRLISRSHTFAIIVILDLKIQIKVCGYTDPFFQKNLNQRSLTPRWPLTPCLLGSHVWLYPRIIVSKSHDNTSMYVDTVINFAKYHIHTYTYYVQNEWSHSLLLNSVQARQKLDTSFLLSYKVLWYAGTGKRHNVCQHHVAIDTGVKQNELHVFQWYENCYCLQVYFWRMMPKFSVNLEIIYHKNQYPIPICNFGFNEPQYSDKCSMCCWSAISFSLVTHTCVLPV